MIVTRYTPDDAPAWDAFVRASRNGTFLLCRGYMDYHRDRFADHSLLVRDPEGALAAVLPAHAAGDRLVSHGGLSYGGFVIGPGMKTPAMLGAFEAVAAYLRGQGFVTFDYKTIPHIYHRQPAEEDRYALFLTGAGLLRRDVLSVVPRGDRLPYQTRRARGIKKAQKAGAAVAEAGACGPYWELLAATLAERFGAEPVHTLAEIELLRARFPRNIRLFTAAAGGELLAGVLVYESERVAHCQYIAASPAGRACAALDLLFDHLLGTVYAEHPYFDFGGSHEDAGRAVNAGLIDQKEGFGARAVAHEQYRIDLTAVRPGALTGAAR
ncbi:GNAT family N-acetyltransferase [Gemmata sp. JC717]|uniref:GNAT family N-acetyltransferase n=1 Tax=Gemmata algarum TaxID=2975278 RepID=UPI0021BA64A5|nr:GNAT family N-acetyltransferase [Gemmata algarum]MDY3554279.1 GNAT family N-acetyltransferase [Gemmata algarum]